MSNSISDGSAHLDRLHHHRMRVKDARAALDAALGRDLAEHYDSTQRPDSEASNGPRRVDSPS